MAIFDLWLNVMTRHVSFLIIEKLFLSTSLFQRDAIASLGLFFGLALHPKNDPSGRQMCEC